MREKLLSYGSRIFCSYELLEMLLYYVIPYKNTNPVAKRLLERFHSLDGVFSASAEELCEVDGVGFAVADFLKKVASLMEGNYSYAGERVLDDYVTVGEFLVSKLSSSKESKCVMLLLDNRMALIDYSEIYDLDFSSGAVKADAFIDIAIRKRAAVAITAHNHPHGPLFPTVGDMATNALITSALNFAGVTHIEHYIISGDKFFGISKQFSLSLVQSPELDRFKESREKYHHG